MNDGPERRAHARVDLGLAVRYDATDGPADATVENLSRGGVLLVTGLVQPEVGKTIRITFLDEHGVEHLIVGKVVRKSPEGMVGVTFLEVDAVTLGYVESVLGDRDADDDRSL